MEQKIKDLRIEIDGISQLTKKLRGLKLPMGKIVAIGLAKDSEDVKYGGLVASQEILKCYDSLRLSKAHLGKVLGVLNVDSPYKNDGNRKIAEDIEPTADMAYHIDSLPDDFPYIQKVDFLRQRIKDVANKVNLTDDSHPLWDDINSDPRTMHFIFNTYNHLIEARFWLGFELERIREED